MKPIFPVRPSNEINFEDENNGFIGVDPNAAATCNGVVSVNGNKKLQFTTSSANWAPSISKELMAYAFYTNNAESISFTVSYKDYKIDSEGTLRAGPIAWYTSGNKYDYWTKSGVGCVINDDGSATITVYAASYTALFDAQGNFISSAGGEDASKGYYFGVKLQFNDDSATQIPSGAVVYLDDFVVNYAA